MKDKKSKLDQYAETLAAMDAEHKTLAEILAWLKEEGCVVAASTLSVYLESQRQAEREAKLLGQIATGAKQCRDVEKMFGENPPPDTDTLIKLVRVLILKFSTESNISPELTEIVFNMLKPVIKWHEVSVKKEALALDRERFEFNAAEAALKAVGELKIIANSKLSDVERIKAARRKLFGRLPEDKPSTPVS